MIQKGYLPCVISPYVRNDYIQALEGAHAESEKFIRFIAEAELETEKDFIRALGLEIPDLKIFKGNNYSGEYYDAVTIF
ncbi:hypothetical protein [Lacrimispora sp.]|uniref:hypothetical protein n=1 Tax=Lacrimispora sp. TaxID=2719234 RepID=UPI0028B207F3|nr:hypothetical protein [Lacrimispora sp.]